MPDSVFRVPRFRGFGGFGVQFDCPRSYYQECIQKGYAAALNPKP